MKDMKLSPAQYAAAATLLFCLASAVHVNAQEFQFERCQIKHKAVEIDACLLYTSPSPRDQRGSRMPSSA